MGGLCRWTYLFLFPFDAGGRYDDANSQYHTGPGSQKIAFIPGKGDLILVDIDEAIAPIHRAACRPTWLYRALHRLAVTQWDIIIWDVDDII